jgi:hypothetical protein
MRNEKPHPDPGAAQDGAREERTDENGTQRD